MRRTGRRTTRVTSRMVNESGEKGSAEPGDARLVALTEELGAQLWRMGAAGPKITQLLSMVQLEGASGDAPRLLGALVEAREPLPLRRVRRVIEQDLDARLQDIFSSFDEQPFAIASLGQVHRARIRDGDHVAVKVQHPDIADESASDLRAIGAVSPIVQRLAPGSDAGALLSKVRERIADELDYEIEAQHQRRLWRLFRDHPHVRVRGGPGGLGDAGVVVHPHARGRHRDPARALAA